jgi:hypothetical protein
MHFRNISRIMDCVGCEKCKIHGKIQILGLGTALKILLEDRTCETLQRNEIIVRHPTIALWCMCVCVHQATNKEASTRR